MAWRYEASTGVLSSPDASRHDTGYSGHGEGLNNPALEQVPDVGPIPRGTWTILTVYDHTRLGPVVMDLAPVIDPEERQAAPAPMGQLCFPFGRTDFRIHGDNAELNQTASHGCVILPRAVRELIAASPDKILLVF